MALIKPPTTTFFQVTFDLPNRGHCSPRKRSLKTPKKVTTGRTWYQKLDMLIYNFLNLELRHVFLSPRWMMMYGISWVWLLPRIPVVNEGLLILESPNFLMLTRHPGVVWPKMMDVFYRVWYMSHSITHVLADETMQMYGNFQGFCLQ